MRRDSSRRSLLTVVPERTRERRLAPSPHFLVNPVHMSSRDKPLSSSSATRSLSSLLKRFRGRILIIIFLVIPYLGYVVHMSVISKNAPKQKYHDIPGARKDNMGFVKDIVIPYDRRWPVWERKNRADRYHEYVYDFIGVLRDWVQPYLPWKIILSLLIVWLARSTISSAAYSFRAYYVEGRHRPFRTFKKRIASWWVLLTKILPLFRWIHIRRYARRVRVRFSLRRVLKFVVLFFLLFDFVPLLSDLASPVPVIILFLLFFNVLHLNTLAKVWTGFNVLRCGYFLSYHNQLLLCVAVLPVVVGLVQLYTPEDVARIIVTKFFCFEIFALFGFVLFIPLFGNTTLMRTHGRGRMYDIEMWDYAHWNEVGIGGQAGNPAQRFHLERAKTSHIIHRRREGMIWYFKLCFTAWNVNHMQDWPLGAPTFYDSVPHRMSHVGGSDRLPEEVTRFPEQSEANSRHLLGGLNRLWVDRELLYLNGILARPPIEPDISLYPPLWLPPIDGISLPYGTPIPLFSVEAARKETARKALEDDDYRAYLVKETDRLRRWTQIEPTGRFQFSDAFDYRKRRVGEATMNMWAYAKKFYRHRRFERLAQGATDIAERHKRLEPVWNVKLLSQFNERLSALYPYSKDSLPQFADFPPVCYGRKLLKPPKFTSDKPHKLSP